MDITQFVVSARNQALLYGDYTTYHRLLAKKLHNLRKKLGIVSKNRSKFTKPGPVSANQIAENHAYATPSFWSSRSLSSLLTRDALDIFTLSCSQLSGPGPMRCA